MTHHTTKCFYVHTPEHTVFLNLSQWWFWWLYGSEVDLQVDQVVMHHPRMLMWYDKSEGLNMYWF